MDSELYLPADDALLEALLRRRACLAEALGNKAIVAVRKVNMLPNGEFVEAYDFMAPLGTTKDTVGEFDSLRREFTALGYEVQYDLLQGDAVRSLIRGNDLMIAICYEHPYA